MCIFTLLSDPFSGVSYELEPPNIRLLVTNQCFEAFTATDRDTLTQMFGWMTKSP